MNIKKKCIKCEKDYEHEQRIVNSNKMEDYCRYLGCCNIKCYNNLSLAERNMLQVSSFLFNEKYRNKIMK